MRGQGYARPAGVDEVGRGPLAGPVVAAAVILPAAWDDPGVADSKQLSDARRRELAPIICAGAVAWALGWAEAGEVDDINIHHASLLAMRRAVAALWPAPDYLLVDGRFCLPLELPQQAVVKGDARCRAVAAASILAKVHRDSLMDRLHQAWPVYNFAANKGYATAGHRQALAAHGPCPEHRKSFGSVAQMGLFDA
ncbi:MAG: ribonuclease HII [Pseudomonadota bacterium]